MNIDERVAKRYLSTQQSAESRGLEFNLTLTCVKNLLRAKRCKYTRKLLTFDVDSPNQLTFDRLDNTLGYVIGNVVACTKEFNQKKGDLTLEELRYIINVTNRGATNG